MIELRLLRFPAFRAATTGGFLFRIGVGATPFLLPLMFQLGFGFTPFQSGLLTLSTGLGAMAMKTLASRILRRFGFRRVMVANAILSSALVAAPALFYAGMPVGVIAATLLVAGFARSLQFTSINVSALSDVPDSLMGRVTSFTSVLQELAGSIGVSVAALGLEAAQRLHGTADAVGRTVPAGLPDDRRDRRRVRADFPQDAARCGPRDAGARRSAGSRRRRPRRPNDEPLVTMMRRLATFLVVCAVAAGLAVVAARGRGSLCRHGHARQRPLDREGAGARGIGQAAGRRRRRRGQRAAPDRRRRAGGRRRRQGARPRTCR